MYISLRVKSYLRVTDLDGLEGLAELVWTSKMINVSADSVSYGALPLVDVDVLQVGVAP